MHATAPHNGMQIRNTNYVLEDSEIADILLYP